MSKILFITGASSGIGLRTALEARKAGWEVIGTVRRSSPELEAAKVTQFILQATASAEDHASVSRQALAVHGHIDAVFLNTGTGCFGTAEEVDLDEAMRVMDVNFWSAWKTLRPLLAHFRQRKAGSIVIHSSQIFEVGYPLSAAYSASKAALTAFGDALKAEMAGLGVRVVSLEGGVYRTAFGEKTATAPAAGLYSHLQPTADYMKGLQGNEPLDPVKGAKRVVDLIVSDADLPSRLLFGAQAYELSRAAYRDRLAAWEANERWSVGIDLVDP